MAAVVIGGAGNRWGAIVGGVVVAYLPERFRELRSDWRAARLRPGADGDRGHLPARRACCHPGVPVSAMKADDELEELEEGTVDV